MISCLRASHRVSALIEDVVADRQRCSSVPSATFVDFYQRDGADTRHRDVGSGGLKSSCEQL